MEWSPSFECHVRPDGEHVYRIGHQLIDEFLEFVVGRARPNTVRAYAHDLCVFFTVVAKDPLEVRPKDVMAFVTAQRRPKPGAENVVRIADGSAGLSAATIKRRLEAIAALLGNRSMDMTLAYARISDKTVADAYFKVTEAVEAQYYGLSGAVAVRSSASSAAPPVSDHRRLLANGHCTRPALLDCAFESVCERCGFFETGPTFLTILKRQRKHADERGQSDRNELFDGLIKGVADAQ